MTDFQLTYGTMFNPPEALHTHFESALEIVRSEMGREYAMVINGEERFSKQKFMSTTPINRTQVLGTIQDVLF